MATTQLALFELVEGQGQAEVPWSSNLEVIDAVIQLAVKDDDLSTPPGSPAEGDRYLVNTGGTGAWAGHDLDVAIYLNGAWRFVELREGFTMWIDDEDNLLAWNGSAFLPLSGDTTDIALTDGSRDYTGAVDIEKATGAYLIFSLSGEANPRAQFSDDRISFGDGGASAVDTVIRRSAANEFTFDDEVRHAADVRLNTTKKLVIRDSDDSHQSTIAAGGQTVDINLVLPTAAPTQTGQVLIGTTAGVESWSAAGAQTSPQRNTRVFRPVLCFTDIGSFQLTTDRAEFTYMGFFPAGTVFKYVCVGMQFAGTSVAAYQLGIFTTPASANKSGQTLTKVVATSSVDSMTSGLTTKRNTSPFNTALTDDSHVWCGIHRNTGTGTNSAYYGVADDYLGGACLRTAASGDLTAGTTFAGTVPATPGTINDPVGVYFKLEMD